MKLSAAGGNWLVSDVSSERAILLAGLERLWSNEGNDWRERGELIGREEAQRAGNDLEFFGHAPPPHSLVSGDALQGRQAPLQNLDQTDLSLLRTLTICMGFSII